MRWVVDTVGIREVRTLMQQAVQVCELWRQIARRQIFLDDDNDMIWRPHGGSRRQGPDRSDYQTQEQPDDQTQEQQP